MRVKSLLFVLIILVLFTVMSFAGITRLINYQGIILGGDEKPLPEGNYKLTFKLYEEDSKLIWTEVHNQVFISGGLVHVILGDITPLELPFDKPYFLGIQIGTDPELQPRMLLTSSAYAFRADDADRLQGFLVSPEPQPNMLVPLDNTGKFPASAIPGGIGAEGAFLKKHAADTSRATLNHVLLLVSNLGSGDGVNARSRDGIGLSARSDNSDGVVGWTGHKDKSGVFGFTENGNGVTGKSTNKYGVFGASVSSYGGYFKSDQDHLDLVLGGLVGRINTDPNLQNSELILSSNHNILLRLDNDGGENSMMKVLNSGGNNVCTINEDGNLALYNAGNKTIERAVVNVRSGIAEGRTMADPLAESGVFPSMVCQMISVGESTGALDAMLEKIADFYDDEVDQAVENLTSAIEPVMMVFMGIVIGGLVIAMYLPIFKMAGAIGG